MFEQTRKQISEDKLTKFMIIFSVLYILSFFILEQRKVPLNVVHCAVDDIVPFCEIFIIPYMYWFVYMGASIYYFLFKCSNNAERKAVMCSLCIGMIVFIFVSAIYPNGHSLRPHIIPDNLFGTLVGILYEIDTPTNILPSLHVYETVVVTIGLLRQEKVKDSGILKSLVVSSAVLIVLSTLFLKQHSFVDVVFALALNLICYMVFYSPFFTRKRKPQNYHIQHSIMER